MVGVWQQWLRSRALLAAHSTGAPDRSPRAAVVPATAAAGGECVARLMPNARDGAHARVPAWRPPGSGWACWEKASAPTPSFIGIMARLSHRPQGSCSSHLRDGAPGLARGGIMLLVSARLYNLGQSCPLQPGARAPSPQAIPKPRTRDGTRPVGGHAALRVSCLGVMYHTGPPHQHDHLSA